MEDHTINSVQLNIGSMKRKIKEKIFVTNNYEQNQTEDIQENENKPIKLEDEMDNFAIKTEYIEQVFTEFENTVEEVCPKKEIKEELITKEENSDIHDSLLDCESQELDFPTAKQLDNQTIWIKTENKADFSNKILKEGVLEIDNYENCKTVKLQQNNPSIERVPNPIEDLLEKFETKTEINEELIIKDENFDTNDSINIFTHSKKKLKPCVKSYDCDVCKKSFKFPSVLRDHKLTHTNEKPFSCDVCRSSFRTNSYLTKHKLIHTDEKPFSCDVCRSSFRSTHHLANHKLIHTGEKPFTCDVCTNSFRTKTHLTIHKFIHTGEKPYECDVCKKSFRDPSALRIHKIIHTKEKPFSCDVCKSSFISKSSLNRHKLIHADEKAFSCDVCKKKFKQKHGLRNHEIIHTAKKSHECDVCNKAFHFKRNLIRHKHIHTGGKL